MSESNHSSKVALITGANKGIGLEIARQLGKQGIKVLIGARDQERRESAAASLREQGIDAQPIALDITDQASVDAAASDVVSRFGRLDILVNNAGIVRDKVPPSQLDIALFRETYETNLFGMFAVTKAMLPLLRKSPAGRIVNLSSGLGSLTHTADPKWPFYAYNAIAYNSSKAAVNALTISFAKELRETPIKVNSADPGYVATDLNGHRGPRTVEQGATAPVRLATLPDDGPTGGYFDEDGPLPW